MNEIELQQLKDRIKLLENLIYEFIKSDRYILLKTAQFLDGRNIQFGLTNGTKLGTATTQLIGFWNTTPTAQPSSSGSNSGWTNGSDVTTYRRDDKVTGGTGSTAYTHGDLVKHLKAIGLLAS